MSRSFKKHPFVKYSDTEMKRIASRMFRRIIRQRVKPWKDRYMYNQHLYCGICECDEYGLCPWVYIDDEPELPHPFEVMDPYSVCDAKSNPYKRYYQGDPVIDKRK